MQPLSASFLRPVSCALLLVGSTLLASNARAGTYDWTGTDPNTGQPIYSPAYSGGTSSEDSVTTNTHVVGQPDSLDARPSPPTYGGGGNVLCAPAANGSATSSTDSTGGPISAKFTWQPAFTGEPPPSAVIIQENCSVKMGWSYSNGATLTGSDSTGFGQSGTISGNTGSNVTIGGTNYSGASPAGDGSVSAPACSPGASQSGNTGTSGGAVQAGCTITYSATISPVTINPFGATSDGKGGWDILVGQHFSPSLAGIPDALLNNTAHPPVYQWSVSGTTFQSWTVSSDQTSTTEVDGPGLLNVASPAWYWNDNNGSGNSKVETVTCTATLTPPDGQGAAFSVTVSQPVTVWVPSWTGTGTGGAVYVVPSGSNYLLEAADSSTSGKNGMTWLLTVASPNSSLFGDGTVSMVQLVIPGRSFQAENVTYHNSTNGEEGLDTRYPTYAATGIYWDHEDHPYFSLTNIAAANGADAYSATMHDGFHDYLCYTPPGSSQSVFLAELAWSTDATVNDPYLNGTYSWSYYGSGTAGTVHPGSETRFFQSNAFPNWTQNSGDGAGYWNSNQ